MRSKVLVPGIEQRSVGSDTKFLFILFIYLKLRIILQKMKI